MIVGSFFFRRMEFFFHIAIHTSLFLVGMTIIYGKFPNTTWVYPTPPIPISYYSNTPSYRSDRFFSKLNQNVSLFLTPSY